MATLTKLRSLEGISDDVLDLIVEKYGDKPGYRVFDERETLSFGKPRKYFLFSNHGNRGKLEWTFIWIKNNLWQFSYMNTEVVNKPAWKDPLKILNEQLEL